MKFKPSKAFYGIVVVTILSGGISLSFATEDYLTPQQSRLFTFSNIVFTAGIRKILNDIDS